MAQIVITITDTPDDSQAAVQFELLGVPCFNPYDADAPGLSQAQKIACALLAGLTVRATTVSEELKYHGVAPGRMN